MKVNLGKTKVMVSGGITKDGLSKTKVDACGVCSLRVKANSVLYVQCVKWIPRWLCWSEKGDCIRDVKGIFERQWSWKKSYVMKRKH